MPDAGLGRITTTLARLRAARWLWAPMLLFLISRIGIAMVAYLAVPLIRDPDPPPFHQQPDASILVDAFGSRWDTAFFVEIAEQGYRNEPSATNPFPSTPFFPLLPLLIRLVTPLAGDTLRAGLLVSNGALLLAMILLYRFVEGEWGRAVAERTVLYVLIFPTSFFGSAIYSESLFLFCAVGAVAFYRRGRWALSALFGFAAALTRSIGVILAPVLLLEWWMAFRKNRTAPEEGEPLDRWDSLSGLIPPVVVPTGLISFMVYLQRKFSIPYAFFYGHYAWGREVQSPLTAITRLFQAPPGGWWQGLMQGAIDHHNWIDFFFFVLFLVLGIVLLAKKRWSEGAFILLSILIPLSTGMLLSMRRIVWVLFPAFVLLAQAGENKWVDRTLIVWFTLGLALFTALFANGYWMV